MLDTAVYIQSNRLNSSFENDMYPYKSSLNLLTHRIICTRFLLLLEFLKKLKYVVEFTLLFKSK